MKTKESQLRASRNYRLRNYERVKETCRQYARIYYNDPIKKELHKKTKATEFVKRIKETCKLGARNYRTAIRWILEADELEHDFQHEGGYLVWEYNLAYRHKKLFKTAGVA